MEKGKVAAVIVAAGRGERAGQSVEGPKQYRRIGGSPIIRRTLKQFLGHEAVDEVVVVIHEDDTALFEKAVGSLGKAVLVVHGGPTRQASVLLGLEALAVDPPAKVLIHDAVRPFIDVELIDRTLAAMEGGRSALPALAICDTIKRAGPDRLILETVPRAGLFGAQTPQGFPYGAILGAHRRAAQATEVAFTDDASVAEWAGLPVALVEGSAANIKLTTAEDIQLSDRSLVTRGESVDVRAGNGYDVHRLTEGDHVTLCGVRIAHDQALDGHSDADVGLHALTDALLATCGAGDIGDHFPPSDPQWRGAASRIFVEKAIEIVRQHGGRVLNADISLICEAPKIAPHREAMRRVIAEMTGLSVDRVSVKATTNETIGFVGRREGIAAIATASVSYGG